MIGEFSLAELAAELGVDAPVRDAVFTSLSTDSRSLQAGDAYLALVGTKFDGHDYASEAVAKGASGLILDRKLEVDAPSLLVNDTQQALCALARLNRRRGRARVCALTGSQGKTTVKEMTASILRQAGSALATRENLNNTIGVPLTLLELEERHEFAVIEMGADRQGEIACSVAAAEPDVALITGASPAHIEGFGSLQGIVQGKGEILDLLGEDGVALLNADDANVHQWQERAARRHCSVRLFGLAETSGADYFAANVETAANGNMCFRLHTPEGAVDVQSALLGMHNVRNAVAASALAMATGATLDHVQLGLAEVEAVPGRLAPRPGHNGSLVLDDSYNAGPESYKAAIDVLVSLPGEPVLIAGDMLELGEQSEQAHREVGEYARQAGLPVLLAIGSRCKAMAEAYGEGAQLFQSSEELLATARTLQSERAVFLVKGSRGSKMETIVNDLVDRGEN